MLLAAAAAVDLAPRAGQWMTGYAARVTPATGVHDPLWARVVLVDDGATRVLLVVCDVIGLHVTLVNTLRAALATRVGTTPAHVVVACTHTHAGPSCYPFRGVMGYVDDAWNTSVCEKILALAATLPAQLAPAVLCHAVTRVPGLGFNRQDHARDVDDELQALALETPHGARIATIVNYAMHAVVLGPRNLLFSGDVPGACMRAIEQTTGGVAFYLQGACGDIDPELNRSKGWGRGDFDDVARLGAQLAEAALAALASAPVSAAARLAAASAIVRVPLDPPPAPAQLAELRRQFERERDQAAHPVDELCARAMLDWAAALQSACENNAVPRELAAECSAVALGDVCLVAAPFELYNDLGRAIKRLAQPRCALIAGYANGYYGYFPTAWAKQQGGYGADSACRWFPDMLTPVSAEAEPALLACVRDLVAVV